MAKKKNQVGKAKRKDQPFAPTDLPAILDGHGARLSEIARAIRPGDETAIEMYAEQLANEIVRTYFRDVAAGVKAANLPRKAFWMPKTTRFRSWPSKACPSPMRSAASSARSSTLSATRSRRLETQGNRHDSHRPTPRSKLMLGVLAIEYGLRMPLYDTLVKFAAGLRAPLAEFDKPDDWKPPKAEGKRK